MRPLALPWEPITAPYLHGVVAQHGLYRAEVVRAYEHDWQLYLYRAGQMLGASCVRFRASEELAELYAAHHTEASAKRAAARIIRELCRGCRAGRPLPAGVDHGEALELEVRS